LDIVIISEFCDSFSNKDNDRFLYLARKLSQKHEVELITSSFQHTAKKQRSQTDYEFDFRLTFISEPGYPRNISFRRFRSHYIWGKNVYKYLKSRKKPDVVYCAVPSLTGPSLVSEYCRKAGIRFVPDVQDLWPEAFRMIINIPVISSLAFFPFSVLANRIYRNADDICGVSETYVRRCLLKNKKGAEGKAVYLGTELQEFDSNVLNNPITSEKKDGDLWLGYCGTLGASYDLIIVMDALKILEQKGENKYTFIVMGDGDRKEEFENYATKNQLNVRFLGRLPYDQMCGWLAACDMAVNPIAHTSAASIINKHADYAAAGIPVLNTQESPEYRSLINRYKMGFNCDNDDPRDMAEKLMLLSENGQLRKQMGENARKCAEELFDRGTTYENLIYTIEKA